MQYNHRDVEKKWQKKWVENKTYQVTEDPSKPKYYVLDMFPYPSGAGLHVGHPLGYIASDIYARFKRLEGYNVLHTMGWDAFGLPAEQYAIQTGTHPAVTTDVNSKRYREQLDQIGLSYDWSREINTSDPKYYKWTQDVFQKLFEHWFCHESNKARPISELTQAFESQGSRGVKAAHNLEEDFSADEWKAFSEKEKGEKLLCFRLAYLADTFVNWCPKLGTVLANDEVQNGYSIRGGHPVEQKKMQQWSLRVSAYAERLLQGLEKIDWSESIKETQRNWIGRSEGAEVRFDLDGGGSVEIFTTRPDTIFGVTFMVLAPESELVEKLTTSEKKAEVDAYLKKALAKTERERMQEKKISGVFTGGHALHPFTGKKIPIWISEYVLASYGTGAIMAVPAHDERDWDFAKTFDLEIIPTIEGGNVQEECFHAKSGKVINSDFLNGLEVQAAISKACEEVEKRGLGSKKINYRLRDAIFSRQRYWGEPFPVYYKDGMPQMLEKEKLPLELPEVDQYLPTEAGDPPLGRAKNWQTDSGDPLELSTMPGFAGSSAYYLRYMDPHNDQELVGKEANSYWKNVDLYLGGSEHATGHLIYARFWNKFLFDLGLICEDEPFKRLVNQGMIQGRSQFVYRVVGTNKFVSQGLKDNFETTEIHVDVSLVDNDVLNLEAFKSWRDEYKDAEFELEEGKYICGSAIEKMSKSLFNVVNPDQIVEDFGADTLRLYEMFLGPLEVSKPWITNGISGVSKFLKKFWNLFFNEQGLKLNDDKANDKELKVLHTLIKKLHEDLPTLSFNTSVSAFMICVNDLGELKCHKREILEKLPVLLSPFAPHMAEEIWEALGNKTSVTEAQLPKHDEKYLVESVHKYPVSVNGKMRFLLELPLSYGKDEIEAAVKKDDRLEGALKGKTPKKVIIVPKKIINFVV